MMKRFLPALVGAMMLWLNVAVLPALVQADDAFVSGQVIKIDETAGKITIKHGPLKKYDMDEGMTMVWRVADPAMLKKVKAGDKIRFVPDRINGQFTVMKIEKVE